MPIAEPEANNAFFEEFLDDYFAECDEHLTIVRRDLLALEDSVYKSRIDRAPLDELFRSFHSLKGISAMVGVREAEHLAHHMESYLRSLLQDRATLTPRGIEGLMAGTKALEEVISVRREQLPTPDIAMVLAQLGALVSSDGHSDQRPPAPGEPASTVKNAGKTWRFEFAPSPQLSQRDINVNSVRARLQEIGELIQAAPQVLPGGGIVFEFVVATPADESVFAAWGADGLTYAPYEATPPAARVEPGLADPSPSVAPPSIVRVSLGRLDELMRMVGELVVSRSRLDDHLRAAERDMAQSRWRPLQEINQAIERQLRDLREAVMRVRMVPIREIFERMQFVVRDLAQESKKRINLELSGQHTEIDKLLVERMMDPLLHLVRNAVSHGLETVAEREAAGKSGDGKISLRAFTAGESVVIEVEDDGRGIARARVAERAREMKLIADDATVDDAMLLDLICSPGFSTREEADRASGRGVGMAVVKNTVQGLGGAFTLDTEAGRGTRFTIQLPITLAILDALIVSVGGQRFAVPQSSVREVIEVDPSTVKAFENNEIISYRGGVLPLLRLARLFGLDEAYRRAFHAFIIGRGPSAAAIAVDRILGQREIVVRAVSDPLIQVAGVSGATELGDGRVVLILDAAGLVGGRI